MFDSLGIGFDLNGSTEMTFRIIGSVLCLVADDLLLDALVHTSRDGIEVHRVLEVIDVEPSAGIAGSVAENIFCRNLKIDAIHLEVELIVGKNNVFGISFEHIAYVRTYAKDMT